jgi:hypothetical protein
VSIILSYVRFNHKIRWIEMPLISKTTREIASLPILLLLVISVSLAVVSAVTYDVVVPGDLDGDLIVSDEEQEAAQSSYDDGKITSEELEKIEHIYENYPRTITDMAGREVTLYKPVERIITTNPDGHPDGDRPRCRRPYCRNRFG